MKNFVVVIILSMSLINCPARADILWNWVNAGTGTEQGTVLTTGELSGGGVAAGSFTILDFSLSASDYDLPVGAFSTEEYTIGQQGIGFEWDGTTITQFWRLDGFYTNGFTFTVANPEVGGPESIVMNTDYFVIGIDNSGDPLYEAQTPVFTPVIPQQDGIVWNWVNSLGTGTEEGTFVTLGTLDGGLAGAGSYELVDFTVSSSGSNLPVGSISGGQYSMGQPGVGFVWDGSNPTEFWRSDGTYTNGLAMYVVNPAVGAPDRIAMSIDHFVVDILYGTVFISESTTVVISPAGTTLPVSRVSFGGLKALFR